MHDGKKDLEDICPNNSLAGHYVQIPADFTALDTYKVVAISVQLFNNSLYNTSLPLLAGKNSLLETSIKQIAPKPNTNAATRQLVGIGVRAA